MWHARCSAIIARMRNRSGANSKPAKVTGSRRCAGAWLGLGLFLTLAIAQSGLAQTRFYVDPDYAGTQTGAASQPWSSLSASAWTAINTALNNGNVTVYFSARRAGSDTHQIYDTAGNGVALSIDLTKKTANTATTLTLDGKSFW